MCYENCEKNPTKKVINIDQGTCVLGDQCKEEDCTTISECGNDRNYKTKEGKCVPIPDRCLVVDVDTGLCKICNGGYYPLKEDLDLNSFYCYKNLEEIIEKKISRITI